jgi:hypothetical protein
MENAWQAILSDSSARREAAETLGLSEAELSRRFSHSPFSAKGAEQGLTGVEIAVFIVVGDVVKDVAKDVLKDSAKAGLRKLWGLIKERVQLSAPADALGAERKLPPAGGDGDEPTAAG